MLSSGNKVIIIIKGYVFLLCTFTMQGFFFFDWGFTTRQDKFTHFEQSQLLGGAKTGYPRKKTPDHPQAELGLSHV